MRHSLLILGPSPAGFAEPSRTRAVLPRPLRVIGAAAAVLAALGFLFVARPPGGAIRSDLVAAGASVRALPALAPADAVRAAVTASFPGRPVSVEPASFPAMVAVTLHDVDRQSCLEAAERARRIEGAVVIELDGYRAPDACGERNDMTWRLMP
jgi:hypothetical protein